jgi:hypothetical protein
LAPLADNGGPTQTHALLPGCLALDAGDSQPIHDPGLTDQRGLTRECDGNGDGYACIDIGAFEAQAVLPPLVGDYNRDGRVNAADYVVWRNTNGQAVADVYAGADGYGDRVIDHNDYLVWRANFGQVMQAPTVEAATESPVAVSAPIEPSADEPHIPRWEWFAQTEARRSTVHTRATDAAFAPAEFDEWENLLLVQLAPIESGGRSGAEQRLTPMVGPEDSTVLPTSLRDRVFEAIGDVSRVRESAGLLTGVRR